MKPALRIGVTQDTLLVFLGRYVRATLEQCTRYRFSWPNSRGFIRGHLNALIDHGLVNYEKGFSQDGKPPYVYCLSTEGWEWVETTHGMPRPHRWRPGEGITDYNRYLHTLAITDFGIALERFCREAGPYVRVVRFLHDRLLPQTKVELPDGSAPARRLDGYFELHVRKGDDAKPKQRHYLLEIDRHSHYQAAIKEKITNQVYYLKGGHYQTDFGKASFTAYLWVCPGNPERVVSLKKTLEQTLGELGAKEFATYFLLTAEDPKTADPVSLFIKPRWSLPFADRSLSVITQHPTGQPSIPLERARFMPQEDYDRLLRAIGESPSYLTSEQDVE